MNFLKLCIKIIFLTLIIFISNKVIADQSWGEWKSINIAQITFKIDSNLNAIVGDSSYSAWRTDGKLDGRKAFEVWVEKNSNKGQASIIHTKFPQGWVILGTENDRKYLIKTTARLFNFSKKNNPIKNLKKNEIERYRDINGRVIPYTVYEHLNKACTVFFKEFYKADSGYLDSAEADEVIAVGFCRNSGLLTENEITALIDSINRI